MTGRTRPGGRTHSVGRAAAVIADGALWVGSVLGACALLAVALGLVFGIRPLIFRSGSMSPTIPAGSLGLAREVAAADVHRGDVVTVPADGGYVTHRVVELRRVPGAVELRLRGDANPEVDAQVYRVQTVDRLVFSLPGLGYPVAWLSRPPGIFVLAGYAAVMLAVIFRRRDGTRGGPDDDHRPPGDPDERTPSAPTTARHRADTITSRHFRAALGVLLVGTTIAVRPTASWAAFTDTTNVSGSTLSAATVPTTTLSCGTLGVLSVAFTWTAVSGATNYTLHYNSGNSTKNTTALTTSINGIATGATAWITVDRAFGSTTWTSVASNKRTYTIVVGAVGLCS